MTFLLAKTLDYQPLDDFELLVRGMDARVKCERLRKACKGRKPFGPNFSARLKHFEDNAIGLRNKVAHRWPTLPEGSSVVYFSTLSAMPFAASGLQQIGLAPDGMSLLKFFENGLWLNFYCNDLNPLCGDKFARETLEIDHPRSPMPPAFR